MDRRCTDRFPVLGLPHGGDGPAPAVGALSSLQPIDFISRQSMSHFLKKMSLPRFFAADVEVPRFLRTLVRARESGLVVLAAAIGALAGLVVAAMSASVSGLHALFFAVPFGQRLSTLATLSPIAAIAVPTLGGLAFGVALLALSRWRPQREIDPIEANALHGGRMSLVGSLTVALQ